MEYIDDFFFLLVLAAIIWLMVPRIVRWATRTDPSGPTIDELFVEDESESPLNW